MTKRFIIAILLVGIVVGGIVGFNMFRDQAIQSFFANRQAPAAPVATVVAESATWSPGLDAIGTVFAARGIDVVAEAAGVVRSVNFTANQLVEEGAALIQIDDAIERADIVAAEASVRVNEQALERAQTLSSRGVSSTANVEEAQAAAASAGAQVARLEAVLRQKAPFAPFTGTIGIPQVEVGQYVTAGAQIASLQDLDTLRADFSVPEQHLARLAIGQPVVLRTESGEVAGEGAISAIEPRIDPRTRLVRVRAEVENPDLTLSPGQFVRVRVVLPPEDGIIALPQTSVVSSLYGDFVYVVVEGEPAAADANLAATPGAAQASQEPAAAPLTVRQVFVQTGRRDGERVEILSGLSDGARVVTAGQNRLSNGSPVTLSPGVQAQTPAEVISER